MPVPLVATVGGSDSNSLVSLADANSYFELTLSGDRWAALDEDTRARALITATYHLAEITWWGDRASEEQALDWPRYYCGASDGTAIPKSITIACCEHALDLASKPASATNASARRARLRADGVTSYRLGDASETYSGKSASTGTGDALSQFSDRVQRLISDWVRIGFRLDSGRRPIHQRFGNGSYDINGHWWPAELGG